MNAFASRLIHYRKRNGLTQAQLSEKADIPQSNISKYENGSAIPRRGTMKKLSSALNCRVEDLDPYLTPVNDTSGMNDFKESVLSSLTEDDYMTIALLKAIKKLSAHDKAKVMEYIMEMFN